MPDLIHFLLVPDNSSARSVRRALAAEGARLGVVAGTWGELLEQANRAYLVSPAGTDWDSRLARAAGEPAGGFWAESLKVDPEGVLAKVGWELRRLLEGLGPGRRVEPAGESRLSDRGRRHLADLARLHEAMEGVPPQGLAAIRTLLSLDASRAVRRIVVHRRKGAPVLSPWQEALLAKLASDLPGGSMESPELDAVLDRMLDPAPSGAAGSALRHLQESLYLSVVSRGNLDDSFTCIGVRDSLEAAEVAAGMAQRAIASGTVIHAGELGLLLPADRSCHGAVREAFGKAGLPLSGLEDPRRLRNLGAEAVLHFLATRRMPAPAMAFAALYASPLMPWDERAGNRLAMEIMRRRYDFRVPDGLSSEGKRMVELIRAKHETPKAVSQALDAFRSLISPPEGLERHAEIARNAVDALGEALRGIAGKEVPWEELASRVPQGSLSSGSVPELTREGVAVFLEDEEPWRAVRLLFVLGFTEGRYPAGPAQSPVFDAADAEVLRGELGYSIETVDEGMSRRRSLLLRQLRIVRDRVVFLVPARDGMGEEVAPSGTIAFLARLFEGVRAPEDLILMLERGSHREKVSGLALAPPADPVEPMAVDLSDPLLSGDLLMDPDGEMRPVSASDHETLMVSPLAWFLDRYKAAPLEWAPETLDPALKGTVAHHVFEKIFPADSPIPTVDDIESSIGRVYNEGILRLAPFLTGAEWYVERRNLLKEIETAALRWREMLAGGGARILGVETSLSGVRGGYPICGRTDLLLALPSGRLFIVDYKKSGSAARRKCMENGYDLQTSLYRHMLRTGKVEGNPGGALDRALEAKEEIGVLYYMMDDQKALTDTAGWPRTVPGIYQLDGGISAKGEALVNERLMELRAGRIRLNTGADEDRFYKLGVKTFALRNSPLITKFLRPAPEEEEAE